MDVEAQGGPAAVAAGGGEGAPRQPRRGPAPIASFDHDGSDESSPESKQTFRLPEIREHPAGAANSNGALLAAPSGGRARSHSTPAVVPGTALPAPAPRIDISRASSSSHHDSRDSSPELALFAGDTGDGRAQRLELAFREDGALDLRSSTEELSFMEPAPGESRPAPPAPAPNTTPAPAVPPPIGPGPAGDRRHSRKDSQSSEAALLGVSGRTSRLSSVGSACSAQSAMSRVSRLSVVSGVSRSPSPHRMLLETSFCGPKPIEADPEACAAAVAEHILEIAKISNDVTATSPPTAAPPPAVDSRDHREVRTEVTVEAARPASAAPTSALLRATRQPALALSPVMAPAAKPPEPEKPEKESKSRARAEERKARPRVRREPSEPEVYKSGNKSKDIIRIKLRPDDDEEEEGEVAARKPASLALGTPAATVPAPPSPAPSRRRSPSPLGPPSVSRKSSFCSLFKSRETIGSPESPQAQEALRRKRSLTEGRARSKSRDRSATPTSSKIRGSVLSLFRTPRKSAASSSPGSRAPSPAPAPAYPCAPPDPRRVHQDKLKYYEEAKNGVIHIPLRTPPEERSGADSPRRSSGAVAGPSSTHAPAPAQMESSRPTSAPQPRETPAPASAAIPRHTTTAPSRAPPMLRTVLPDGSIIIPLHSPTERVVETAFPEPTRPRDPPTPPEPRPTSRRDDESTPSRMEPAATSVSSPEAAAVPAPSPPREPRPKAPDPVPSPPDQPPPEVTSKRRKERFVFTTHVGSREQVFSTQFSITKTPSVTSEISGSFPSFENGTGELRDTHITAEAPPPATDAGAAPMARGASDVTSEDALTPQEPPRDSSESEPSSEAAPPQAGNDVERRGLVVQESFEEELPYIPTTLPQERSVAVPMVPVRERGGVLVRGVQRPRATITTTTATATATVAPPATAATAPSSAAPDKLRIKLPRRSRVATSSAPTSARERTRSGSASGNGNGESGGEGHAKQEWIDFEEVPERRKQPKRIQTLPASAAAGAGVLFSYVEPEHCRCECHAHTHAPARDDQLPLLADADDMHNSRISTSSAECGEETAEGAAEARGTGERPPPFPTDLHQRNDAHAHHENAGGRP